jgi:hypothetical protein
MNHGHGIGNVCEVQLLPQSSVFLFELGHGRLQLRNECLRGRELRLQVGNGGLWVGRIECEANDAESTSRPLRRANTLWLRFADTFVAAFWQPALATSIRRRPLPLLSFRVFSITTIKVCEVADRSSHGRMRRKKGKKSVFYAITEKNTCKNRHTVCYIIVNAI